MKTSCTLKRAGGTILILITTTLTGVWCLAKPVLADEPSGADASTDDTVNVHFSTGIAEIVRMVEAKVDPDVICAYIQNSRIADNPSAEEIIVLKQKGVPGEVLTALIQKGAELRADRSRAHPAPAGAAAAPYASGPSYPYDYGAYPYSDYGAYGYPYYPYSYYPWYAYAYPWWGFYSPFFFGFDHFHHFHDFDHGHFDRFGHFDHFGHFNARSFNGLNRGLAPRNMSPWAPANRFGGGAFAARNAPWAPAQSFARRPGAFAMRSGGFGGRPGSFGGGARLGGFGGARMGGGHR